MIPTVHGPAGPTYGNGNKIGIFFKKIYVIMEKAMGPTRPPSKIHGPHHQAPHSLSVPPMNEASVLFFPFTIVLPMGSEISRLDSIRQRFYF